MHQKLANGQAYLGLAYDPGSFSLIIPAAEDSIVEDFTITNNGSRELNVTFPRGNTETGNAYFDGSGDYVAIWPPRSFGKYGCTDNGVLVVRENNGHFEFNGKNRRYYQFAVNSSEQVYFYKGYGNVSNHYYQNGRPASISI